jgi:hypothetical protein
MYDFNSHSLNGREVAYCALPYHAVDLALRHDKLTQAAKNAYIALLSYAAYKNRLTFKITSIWLSEKLSVTRKTAINVLAQLKEFGFATNQGIVIPNTDNFCTSKKEGVDKKTKSADTPKTAAQRESSIKEEPIKEENLNADAPVLNTAPEATSTICYESQYNTFLSVGFSPEKAAVKAQKMVEISLGKNTQSPCKNYTHNNKPSLTTPKENIPANTDDNRSNPSIRTANKQGRFFNSARRGLVKDAQSVANKVASTVKTIFGGKRIATPKPYITAALKRMGVSSMLELERYYDEITYSIKNKQMISIDACLWLIESGKWKAPAGMY